MTQVWNNNAWTDASVTAPNPNFGQLWPGAIDPKQHEEQNLGPDRPSPTGVYPENDFLGTVSAGTYAPPSGTVEQGLSYGNHDVAIPTFDSNSGNQYGPGAISEIHEYGTGSSLKGFGTPADIGQPFTTRVPNQSYAPAWEWDSGTGQRDYDPFDYVAHDFNDYGLHSVGDVRPKWYDGEYPALYPNVAYIPPAQSVEATPYSVSGLTPDMSPRTSASVLYTSPPDPQVMTLQPSGAPASVRNDWE
jgi:hypothetical protein